MGWMMCWVPRDKHTREGPDGHSKVSADTIQEICHGKGIGRESIPERELPGKPAEEASGPVAELGMHSTWVGATE